MITAKKNVHQQRRAVPIGAAARVRRVAAVCFALAAALMVACGGGEEPEPTPSNTPAVVVTKPPTPTPTPPPPPTPTPYDGPVNPLTGLPMDASKAAARPIAIMLNNRTIAQPQLGVSKADILVETLVEGGITRMLALYQDVEAIGVIGSIRSARPYYVDVAQGFDAVYIHAGGSEDAYSVLMSRDITRLDGVNGKRQEIFYRDSTRRRTMGYEHSMVTTGELISRYLPVYGFRLEHEKGYNVGLSFKEDYEISGLPADSIKIKYSSSKTTSFEYDAETGEYAAWQHGGAYKDGNDNALVSFANIVIIKTTISEIKGDPYGCLRVDLTGGGDGYLAVGGKWIPIKWKKDAPDSPFVFTGEDGKAVTLRAGHTYIGIVAGNTPVEIEENANNSD
ncbi:MAG: DUF3048 domain-containing protein [Oscillospiraceae bacterium]|jgi:hypothetical protein|nr:DUF3048 domain-containing protein [Oscillospiraceae bacterium]